MDELDIIQQGVQGVLDDIEGNLDHDIVKEGQAGTDDGWCQDIPDDVFDTAPNLLAQQISAQERLKKQKIQGGLFAK